MPLQPTLLTAPSFFPSMASIKHLAFEHNTLSKAMYGHTPASTLQAWFVKREAVDALNPCQRIVGALDTETGQLVAYGKWAFPSSLSMGGGVDGEWEGGRFGCGRDGERFECGRDGDGESGGKGVEKEKEKVYPPEGVRLDVWERFRGELDAVRGRYLDCERDFCLHSLATRPDYQGRGCGTMILRWGIERADEVGARCYLEATSDAYPLYCKVGFREVDEVVLDLRDYGEDVHVIKVMARESRSGTL